MSDSNLDSGLDPGGLTSGGAIGPTTDGTAMLQFMTGLDASGTLDYTDPNFWNWLHDNPATYSKTGGALIAHKWTPGSTVTYWFNSASNWTSAEQSSLTQALNLWSSVANIHFTQSNASSQPANAIIITRGSNGQAATSAPYSYNAGLNVGIIDSASLSIDTKVSVWSALDSFASGFVFGRQTVLHELGHAIGLGHTGPYDASLTAAQVRYTADTRQYTVMSYVDAGSAIASTVATNNGDTPSPANYHNTSGTFFLTTPGQYDILAVQRMYGAPTSGALTTGETFGFNASAALTSSLPFYDFTVNTNPVVTIWDSATGNTLDLSGFTLPSTVDLNPGQFSSTNGMTDNIGIAFDTWVDAAVGGSGNDTFYLNAHSNTVDGGSGSNTAVFSGTMANYTLALKAGVVTAINGGDTDTLSNIQTLQFADQSIASSSIACFAEGTRILTPDGAIAVEHLREGDMVRTAAGEDRPVRWIGYRRINLLAHPHPRRAAPVRIRRGAFGFGLPVRDLLLSPDPAVLVDDVLIPVSQLVNGCTVVQELDATSVTYLHVELDRHDVVLAEGLAVESYLDTGNRAMFANVGLALVLHPEFSVQAGLKRWELDACAPLVTEGAVVHAARRRLLQQASFQGCVRDPDPRLRLLCGNRAITPLPNSTRCVFALPARSQRLHICSNSAVPVEVDAHDSDRRQLGLAVARMAVIDANGRVELPLDHPALCDGWHDVERSGQTIWRWTNGAALLSLSRPTEAGTLLEIELHAQLPGYWTWRGENRSANDSTRMTRQIRSSGSKAASPIRSSA